MIAFTLRAFRQRAVQPFQVLANKVDAVIVLHPPIGADKRLFALNAHAVFRNITRQIAVVFFQIHQDVVQPLFVDLPAAVRD